MEENIQEAAIAKAEKKENIKDATEVRVLLKIKKSTKNATIPTFAYAGDACFDLYAATSVEIPPKQAREVILGIASEIPEGYEVQIRPRSGLAFKDDLQVHPGTIDSGYRGDWVVKVFNHSNHMYVITLGDRIAQGALRSVPRIQIQEVSRLLPSPRGERGIGSSGKN